MKKYILIFTLGISLLSFTNSTYEPQIGTRIGNQAPELNYISPSGEKIALSSLRGKYVLIDFWASWCRPCRKENPNVVAAYQKFKNIKFNNGNGFTVYNYSLDKKKARWTKAIEKDHLEWPNHVSELGQHEGALKYRVMGIPTNFLIDGNGIIIARNLHQEQLGKFLASKMIK